MSSNWSLMSSRLRPSVWLLRSWASCFSSARSGPPTALSDWTIALRVFMFRRFSKAIEVFAGLADLLGVVPDLGFHDLLVGLGLPIIDMAAGDKTGPQRQPGPGQR